jgi:two-component system sensor histidine kinase KdpD
VAAGNLRSAGAGDELRRDQLDVIESKLHASTGCSRTSSTWHASRPAIDAEREWVHPADIVDAAVRQVQHTLQNHPARARGGRALIGSSDPRASPTALAHLLENAGQYAPADTPITVSAKIDEAGLTLSVRDRGPGIAAQDVEHLFEQFFRGAGAQHRSFGTGMGLAITRGLLAAEGGRVWAENHPDGGACFTLHIPATARQGSPTGEGPS